MGPLKSYASDFKGKIIAKNIFVVSLAIGSIRSIVALRSGRRLVRSPSAKYRQQTIPIEKRGAMSGLIRTSSTRPVLFSGIVEWPSPAYHFAED
jgi:hypothetical protein